ncbi:MAG: hypothetical protein MUE72_02495 [Chitinophagaceae bacterium]|jgi:hypothetical protein|nr:hypothetical protein [Chitinophagaceae bacterium]
MTIGIISEGITDRPVLKALLESYFKSFGHAITYTPTSLLPENEESVGWSKVLAYIASERFRDAFDFTSYIIIQIDSDSHFEIGFDVPYQQSTELLIEEIKLKLIEKIGNEFYQAHSDRIIFAISINEIECWLLPFYATKPAHISKENNCIHTLNTYLNKLGFTLPAGKHKKESLPFYLEAAKKVLDKKTFLRVYKKNLSLRFFIERELNKIAV